MKYERLTKRSEEFGIILRCDHCEKVRECPSLLRENYGETEDCFDAAYKRLAALEDMIENGTLIPRYFVQKDELPNGTVWHNVCSFSEHHCSIERQCRTQKEAEQFLAKLIKEHSEGK